jgi:hypothetical protein
MRLLSCLALTLASAVLPAQDFDFKGVPADYAITFATGSSRGLKISDSPEAKAFKARMEKSLAGLDAGAKNSKEMQEAIKAATGLDLESPDNRIAGGVSLDAAGQLSGGVIVRARHDSKKLSAHAVAKKVGTVQAGATKGWNGQELLASLSDELAKAAKDFPTPATAAGVPASEPIGVFDLDDNTLVIAQPKDAARIIDTLKGKGASYALNTSLRPQVNATGRPYAVVSVNAAKLPPSAELTNSGFQGAVFAMGESGSNQVMKVSAYFTSKEKAAPMAQQAQGMLAMAPMMLAGDPSKPQSDEDKAMMAILGELLAGIQPVEAKGNQVTLTAKWETTKLFGMIEKIIALGATKSKAAPQPATK